jgi:hypothetical protein
VKQEDRPAKRFEVGGVRDRGFLVKSPVYEPLSAQDASFVFFEHRATHMHVAALAIFDVGPLRSATGGVDGVRLARYGESQLARLPRYRQKLAFAPLSGRPVWVDDQSKPLARFEAVRTETARLKSSHAADGIDFLGQLVDRAGSTWLTGVFARIALRVQPYNQIVSNVPGPQYPLYVLGARLLELYPMPPLFERQGLGTAVMSYDQGTLVIYTNHTSTDRWPVSVAAPSPRSGGV